MSNKEIKANIPQLTKAFKAHGRISEAGDTISHQLLRFYANECGLKAIFLKENKLQDTSAFEGQIGRKYGHGHDLAKWINELKIPHFAIKKYSDNDNNPVRQVHEKLRYGIVSNGHDEFLKGLYTLLKKYLK
jgi:hypothetical protein